MPHSLYLKCGWRTIERPQRKTLDFVRWSSSAVLQPSWVCRATRRILVSRHSNKEPLYKYPLTALPKASKCAVRALADTLRMEALRLSGPVSTYTIRCAFPSNFISQAFTEEQKMKPDLTKRMEGTLGSIAELEKRFPSAEEVAQGIIKGVGSDDFAICNDSNEAALLFTNMIGPSPKRGLGIIDSFLATVLGLIVWPIVRHRWDRMCKGDRGQAGIGDATG